MTSSSVTTGNRGGRGPEYEGVIGEALERVVEDDDERRDVEEWEEYEEEGKEEEKEASCVFCMRMRRSLYSRGASWHAGCRRALANGKDFG